MAVSKLWPVTVRLATVLDYASNPEKTSKAKSKYNNADYQALRDVVNYVKNGEKTEQELFCEGINCTPAIAREQFVTVKEQFDKTDGIQAYHGYLSFKETDITPELAQHIGMEFANSVWGKKYQVLVTTHLNTEHLHCHFVINSVSFVDGKRCRDTSWFKFYKEADRICEKYGISTIKEPERYPDAKYLTQKDKAGMPTRYNLARAALDEAIAMSHNLRQLEYHLSEMGYTLGSNPKRKYWTIKGKDDERPLRLNRLGEEYTKERITQRLIENRDNIDFEPFQPKTYRPKQYRLRTRSDKIGEVGGLHGLYLYYCYRLGYLPKYKAGQQNHARVHYLFKEDLMKIDELTKQVTLLGKHHIGTDEQLFSYQHSVEEQIKTLTADRTHLRNEIRKVNITDAELSQAKSSISLLTQKLTAPIDVTTVEELPSPNMGAFYKNEDQTLYIKRDIGDSVTLCQCVAQELGHAQLAMNCEAYSRRDMGFSAVCVGYMLCRKFGVDVKNFAIDRIPEELAGKSPKEIRAELSKTRAAMSEIGSRVSEEIYRRRADRSKDQER